MNLTWESPHFFSLLLLLPLLGWLYYSREKKKVYKAVIPTLRNIGSSRSGLLSWVHLPVLLKLLALAFLITALSRPRGVSQGKEVWSEGIDIVLVLDISASMLARDFKPDRARAAKEVALEFIRNRPQDRIGVVLFAKHAFTQCPLTIDHSVLQELVNKVEVGLTDPNNTAIGSALAVALRRLEHSSAKSKVIILMTDGENNFGLPPLTVAEIAQSLGVRVYSIGVGSRGTAPYPVQDVFGRTILQPMPVSIDESLLRQIAEMTGGRYFRATDENKLKAIFADIDRMEKSRIEVKAYRQYSEKFFPWLGSGLVLLMLSLTADMSLFRRLV